MNHGVRIIGMLLSLKTYFLSILQIGFNTVRLCKDTKNMG
jgi:hypothetical protein